MPDVHLPHQLDAPLRGPRLVLRHMTMDDVDDVHAYQSRPEVARYVPYEPRSREEVAEKVRKFSQAFVLAGDGDFWQLAIERADAPAGSSATSTSRSAASRTRPGRSAGRCTRTSRAAAT